MVQSQVHDQAAPRDPTNRWDFRHLVARSGADAVNAADPGIRCAGARRRISTYAAAVCRVRMNWHGLQKGSGAKEEKAYDKEP